MQSEIIWIKLCWIQNNIDSKNMSILGFSQSLQSLLWSTQELRVASIKIIINEILMIAA